MAHSVPTSNVPSLCQGACRALQQQHQEAQSEVERATEERKRIEEELQASCRILGVSKAL